MKTKDISKFVALAQKNGKARFAVVGAGTSWTIFEGADLANAMAEEGKTFIKASCRKNKGALAMLVVGGPAEVTALKTKVFGTLLKADPKFCTFRTVSQADDAELEKILAELDALATQVSQVQDPAVDLLVNGVKELVEDGEPALARTKIGMLKSKLTTALQPKATPTATPPKDGADTLSKGQPKPSANGDLAAEWKAKLAEWLPAIRSAMTGGPNAVAIGKLLAQANALAKPGGDMAQALAQLTECHTLANAAKEEPSAGESPSEEAEETPTTSMGLWNQTKYRVDAEINRLCDFFRKTREEPCLEAADALAKAMDLFKVDLTTALMNIDNAQGEQKKQQYPRVCKILDAYKTSVLSDPYLTAADTNPFVPVNSRKPLLTALHQIQKMLQTQIGG